LKPLHYRGVGEIRVESGKQSGGRPVFLRTCKNTPSPTPQRNYPLELPTPAFKPRLAPTPYFHLSGNEWDIGLPVFYRETSIVFGPFNPHSFQVQKRRKPA